MKKTVKTVKRVNSQRKTVKNRPKSAVKPPKRRKKAGVSDGLRAFFLTGVIVAFSAVISFALIRFYPPQEKEDSELQLAVEPKQETVFTEPKTNVNSNVPVTESPKPEITVSIQRPQPPQNRNTAPTPSTPAVTNSAPAVTGAPSSTVTSAVVPPKPPERQIANLGTLVFVIDDAGNNLRELEPLLRIPYPFTVAVLPGLPYSAEAARRIRAAGKEVILHQPMEAIGAQNPGPGAIYSGMGASEIRAILARNIAEVGPVAGINNHQGSKITMDREAVQTILSFCAENGIYFLDSRTTADTVVPVVARNMGIRIAERNVFIDNEQNKASMLGYIEGGLARAQRNGSVVMIGHTWSPDLAPLLAEQFPLLTNQGYTIKTVSDIIK